MVMMSTTATATNTSTTTTMRSSSFSSSLHMHFRRYRSRGCDHNKNNIVANNEQHHRACRGSGSVNKNNDSRKKVKGTNSRSTIKRSVSSSSLISSSSHYDTTTQHQERSTSKDLKLDHHDSMQQQCRDQQYDGIIKTTDQNQYHRRGLIIGGSSDTRTTKVMMITTRDHTSSSSSDDDDEEEVGEEHQEEHLSSNPDEDDDGLLRGSSKERRFMMCDSSVMSGNGKTHHDLVVQGCNSSRGATDGHRCKDLLLLYDGGDDEEKKSDHDDVCNDNDVGKHGDVVPRNNRGTTNTNTTRSRKLLRDVVEGSVDNERNDNDDLFTVIIGGGRGGAAGSDHEHDAVTAEVETMMITGTETDDDYCNLTTTSRTSTTTSDRNPRSASSSSLSLSSSSTSPTMLVEEEEGQADHHDNTSRRAVGALRMELDAKTVQCDALEKTVDRLAKLIAEMDDELDIKKLTIERLSMKLQAVTFVTQDENDDYVESHVRYNADDSHNKDHCDNNNETTKKQLGLKAFHLSENTTINDKTTTVAKTLPHGTKSSTSTLPRRRHDYVGGSNDDEQSLSLPVAASPPRVTVEKQNDDKTAGTSPDTCKTGASPQTYVEKDGIKTSAASSDIYNGPVDLDDDPGEEDEEDGFSTVAKISWTSATNTGSIATSAKNVPITGDDGDHYNNTAKIGGRSKGTDAISMATPTLPVGPSSEQNRCSTSRMTSSTTAGATKFSSITTKSSLSYSSSSKMSKSSSSSSSSSPGQAAFYRVIMERDKAKRYVHQLQKDLVRTRSENDKLRNDLARTRAFAQLAFMTSEDDDDNKSCLDHSNNSQEQEKGAEEKAQSMAGRGRGGSDGICSASQLRKRDLTATVNGATATAATSSTMEKDLTKVSRTVLFESDGNNDSDRCGIMTVGPSNNKKMGCIRRAMRNMAAARASRKASSLSLDYNDSRSLSSDVQTIATTMDATILSSVIKDAQQETKTMADMILTKQKIQTDEDTTCSESTPSPPALDHHSSSDDHQSIIVEDVYYQQFL